MDDSISSYQDTIEATPHIDNYRNVLSVFNENLRTRPSLRELHDANFGAPSNLQQQASIPQREILPMAEVKPANGSDQAPAPSREVTPELQEGQTGTKSSTATGRSPKLGWIEGVLARCVLNIIGVMLYLRLSWVAGQAGITAGITVLTSISMCAICTNGELKGSGAYFLISRSLGPEFGGSIGLILAFANAVAVAMYVVGFSETVRDIMKESNVEIIDGSHNDIRIISLIVLLVLYIIVNFGIELESKAQVGLLILLLVSLVNFCIGTVLPVTEDQRIKGITGIKWSTIKENLFPSFRGESFIRIFAVFFPAATGIMAGANAYSDLDDPQSAIPKGTLSAIAITSAIYLFAVVLTGATCLRDAFGPLNITNSTSMMDGVPMTFDEAMISCKLNNTCQYGLLNYFQIMELESGWGPLVTAGIFAATLSSALACFAFGPKVYQAVCKDNLFPYIRYFAKGYGNNDEPRRAYCLTLCIAIFMIMIGDLNLIAPIISNFFLAAYALINYACFDASFAESPGFRPSFHLYNMWLSLFGAILCILCMFIINWWAALLTYTFMFSLYVYILRRKPDVNWGSSIQAHSYKSALQSMFKLTSTEDHVKNYRPQILVLSGNPVARPSLVDFVSNITRDFSLLVFGHVIVHQQPELLAEGMKDMERNIQYWLYERKIKAFYIPCATHALDSGMLELLQLAGLGKLRPNILLMGYKHIWMDCPLEDVYSYVNLIHNGFDANMGVGILRVTNGLDFSEQMREINHKDIEHLTVPNVATPAFLRNRSYIEVKVAENEIEEGMMRLYAGKMHHSEQEGMKKSIGSQIFNKVSSVLGKHHNESGDFTKPTITVENMEEPTEKQNLNKSSLKKNASFDRRQHLRPRKEDGEHLLKDMELAQVQMQTSITQFQRKVAAGGGKKEVIDVWWLYDDGGLTLLIPHILVNNKSYLEGAKVRVFAIATSGDKIEMEQRSLAALLHKFRIDYSDVFVLPDICKTPKKETLAYFDKIISNFKQSDTGKLDERLISDADLVLHKTRSYRQMRVRELLKQHSKESSLIILTLPIPRKGVLPCSLYMAWLELLTADLPPTLLLRGNQQSVITFYT